MLLAYNNNELKLSKRLLKLMDEHPGYSGMLIAFHFWQQTFLPLSLD